MLSMHSAASHKPEVFKKPKAQDQSKHKKENVSDFNRNLKQRSKLSTTGASKLHHHQFSNSSSATPMARPTTPLGYTSNHNSSMLSVNRLKHFDSMNSIGLTNLSPATSNGAAAAGFGFSDEDALFDFSGTGYQDDFFRLETGFNEPFRLWVDDDMKVDYSADHRTYLTPSADPVENFDSFPRSDQQVDFTPFLERLETLRGGEKSELAQIVMKLIAKYFHDKITVFKNQEKIFDIPSSQYDGLQRLDSSASLNENTKVICNFDFNSAETRESFRNFLFDADAFLEEREDLKMALRSLLPPSFVSSIVAAPVDSLRRMRTRGKKSKALAQIRMLDLEPEQTSRERKGRKRGRPRKNTVLSDDPDSSGKKLMDDDIGKIESSAARRRRLESTMSTTSEKVLPVSSFTDIPSISKGFKSGKKKVDGTDDDWRPEKKKPRATSIKKEGGKDDAKKINKLKTPSDKAKEEAELLSMKPEKLDAHIVSLQQQLKNVKHKHRKGTICPRCTTEQRLKLATRVRTRSAQEAKIVKPVQKSAFPKTDDADNFEEEKPVENESTGANVSEGVAISTEEKPEEVGDNSPEADAVEDEENNSETATVEPQEDKQEIL